VDAPAAASSVTVSTKRRSVTRGSPATRCVMTNGALKYRSNCDGRHQSQGSVKDRQG
jgi:hypothetical protein